MGGKNMKNIELNYYLELNGLLKNSKYENKVEKLIDDLSKWLKGKFDIVDIVYHIVNDKTYSNKTYNYDFTISREQKIQSINLKYNELLDNCLLDLGIDVVTL
jgi:hypothetical protein